VLGFLQLCPFLPETRLDANVGIWAGWSSSVMFLRSAATSCFFCWDIQYWDMQWASCFGCWQIDLEVHWA
jgi:hypothetical protein